MLDAVPRGRLRPLARPAAYLACGVAIWAGLDLSGLDLLLSRPFYDAASGGFPLMNEWWLAAAGHTGLKRLSLLAWLATMLAAAFAPARLAAWRAPLAEAALLMAGCALLVLWMRGLSAHSCPWDLAGFGGQAAHFTLGAAVPADPGPGRCMPAAHPSSGFALFGLYFALREFRPRVARIVLALAWTLGLLATFVQVARGAHFVSHALWTAWLCWGTAWAAHAAIARARPAELQSRESPVA